MTEHLWMLIGKSPIPIAIAIECLRPTRVTPIATDPSAVDQLRTAYPWVAWTPTVVVDGFEPNRAGETLREAGLEPGDLFWGPGTTPMNIEVVHRWTLDQATTWGDNEFRRWYLPARGGVLLPDTGPEVRVADGLAAAIRDRVDVLCTLDDLLTLSRLPPGSVVRSARQVTPPDASPYDPDLLCQPVVDLLEFQPANPATIQSATIGGGGTRGDLLEAVVFHLVVKILDGVRSSLPTTVSLNVVAAPPGQPPVVELDVVIQSGPLLTNISCGAVQQNVLKLKSMEAQQRAQQMGGSEARACLVGQRTNLTAAGGVPQRHSIVSEDSPEQRRRLGIVEDWGSSGARIGLCRLDELFASRDPADVRSGLQDPVAQAPSIPGLAEFVAFVRNSVFG